MSRVVFLVEQLAPGLFILLALGLLLTLRRLLRARRSLRATDFELEQEMARRARGDAWAILLLLLEFSLIILGVLVVVAPTIRDAGDFAPVRSESDGQFNTQVPAFSRGAQINASGVNLTPDDPALRVLATPTLTPTPVGTIVPNAPTSVGCNEEGAMLQVPANGMRVFEPVSVVGTAFMDDFAFYRFEIRGPSTGGSFAPLLDHTQPVRQRSALGQFVPAFYLPGVYEFRLSVFDIFNAPGPSCTVNIYLSEPLPTATPRGT
ncbi:MAG: hypothetical protein J4G17_05870 [Anaerolineae bacterium]|nr:hypothetical protein [Anaerolineae bacterium]